jgi:hypothetical protein
MLKRLSITVLFLALLLAACQANTPVVTETESAILSETQAPIAAEPTSTSTEVVQATEKTAADTAPSPTSAETALEASGPPAGCTVVSPQPTPGPTQRSIFPPVSQDDWTQGPEDAYVTVLEYADFQ